MFSKQVVKEDLLETASERCKTKQNRNKQARQVKTDLDQ